MLSQVYTECIKYRLELLLKLGKKKKKIYYSLQRVPDMKGFSLKNFPSVPVDSSYPMKVLSFYNNNFILLNAKLPQRIHPAISHVKAERNIGENPNVTGQ